ncbi:MAG: DUF5615 family PIN-like protein [Chromatiales bacterium]
MKLLLDENLSRRLLPFLLSAYPDSTQVALAGLERASDRDVWEFARANAFVIVSRDSDFYELSQLHGAPPQVIWLRTGSVPNAVVARLLVDHQAEIERLLLVEGRACVELY